MIQQEAYSKNSWISKGLKRGGRLLSLVIFSSALLLSVKMISGWDHVHPYITQIFDKKSEQALLPLEKEKVSLEDSKEKKFSLLEGTKNTFSSSSEIVESKASNSLDLTAEEIKILQELMQRREQLTLREKELESKEITLKAVEARLDSKLNELKDIQEKIEKTIEIEEEKQKAHLEKVSKIYERMPPKEAARILQDLPLGLVVRIIARMEEKEGAAVISKMNGESAQLITRKLAENHNLTQTLEEKLSE